MFAPNMVCFFLFVLPFHDSNQKIMFQRDNLMTGLECETIGVNNETGMYPSRIDKVTAYNSNTKRSQWLQSMVFYITLHVFYATVVSYTLN